MGKIYMKWARLHQVPQPMIKSSNIPSLLSYSSTYYKIVHNHITYRINPYISMMEHYKTELTSNPLWYLSIYTYTFWALQSFTLYYQNPNPTNIRSSSHVLMLFFLPAVSILVHAFFHAHVLCFPLVVTSFYACFLSPRSSLFPLRYAANKPPTLTCGLS